MKARIISLIMLLVLSTACKKEKNEVAPATQQSISASKTTTTSSPCPESIRLTGNSPAGNKLQAKFNPVNVPYAIRVVQNGTATTDQGSTAGNSGVWNSQNTYTSPELGLQLLDANGNIICTCNYDANGKLKTELVKAASVSDFKLDFNPYSSITINWKSVEEVGVKQYVIERTKNGVLDKSITVIESELKGPGQAYSVVDNDEAFEDFFLYKYFLYAVFQDDTRILVAEQVENKCQISDFNIDFDGVETATVTWKSVDEVGVRAYVLQRYNGDDYDKGTVILPTGAGSSYSSIDNEIWYIPETMYFELVCVYDDYERVLIAQRKPVRPYQYE